MKTIEELVKELMKQLVKQDSWLAELSKEVEPGQVMKVPNPFLENQVEKAKYVKRLRARVGDINVLLSYGYKKYPELSYTAFVGVRGASIDMEMYDPTPEVKLTIREDL